VRAESITAMMVYTYNAAGLRVAQSVDGDVTTFVWDWASEVPEMLSEGQAMGSSVALYLVGHETLGRWDGADWTYYLPDALGSIRQEADGTGAVMDSREWTPFGVEVGTAQEGLGYAGEWQTGYIDLLYLRSRWYAVEAGRFTTPDTILPDFQNPQSINRYAYALGNSIRYTDPTGHCITPFCIGEIALGVGVAALLFSCSGEFEPRYCPPSKSYAECYEMKGYMQFESEQCIDEIQFLALQEAVFQKLQNMDPPPKPGMDIRSSRWYFDTPFWNGPGIPDDEVCLCSEGKCCKRSEVNYFAQGMWGAAAGETIEETLDVVERYKQKRYGESPTECVIFWTTYGYEAYEGIQ
jgi:RHS repeat-associated protein